MGDWLAANLVEIPDGGLGACLSTFCTRDRGETIGSGGKENAMSGHKVLVVGMAVILLLVASVPASAQRGISVDPPQGTPQAEEPNPDLDLRENVAQSFFSALLALIDQFFQLIFGVSFLGDLFDAATMTDDTAMSAVDDPNVTFPATVSIVAQYC